MTKSIPLKKFVNHKRTVVDYALVDDDDFERLHLYSWYKLSNGYAMRSYKEEKKKIYVLMHRDVLGVVFSTDKSIVTDHKNGNRLDNRKNNLRLCTVQQNTWNSRPLSTKIYSNAKGVTYSKHHKKWKSGIYKNGKYFLIGYFDAEKDAIDARKKIAKEIRGEYSYE